ncbi:MAG TPA: hypothetical protein DC061_16970 [Gemmobacter sp.]|nr:hypothetical protein [Gemmobacter sp.]
MSEVADVGTVGAGLVRIVVPPSDRCMATALGTKVIAEDGTALPGVYSIKIRPLTADGLVVAEIEVAMGRLDIEAHPLLGRDSLARAAAAYGLRLVDAQGAEIMATASLPSCDLDGKRLGGGGSADATPRTSRDPIMPPHLHGRALSIDDQGLLWLGVTEVNAQCVPRTRWVGPYKIEALAEGLPVIDYGQNLGTFSEDVPQGARMGWMLARAVESEAG